MVEAVHGLTTETYEVTVTAKKKGNLSWFTLHIINNSVPITARGLNQYLF